MPLLLLLAVFGMVFSTEATAKANPAPSLPPAGGDLLGGAQFLKDLHPDMVRFVLEVARRAKSEGIGIKLLSGKRTCAQQNALYAQGRTAQGPIITGARGCSSWHVQGRAVDFLPSPATEAAYARVGAIAKELGGVWGGQFSNLRDLGHIEYHPGLKISDVCPDPDRCLDPGMSLTQNPPPSAWLMPVKGLPYGAIFYTYQGQGEPWGQVGYSQFATPQERDVFLAGARSAVKLAQVSATPDKLPRPLDLYVVILDGGQPKEQGYLSQIRGNPWPPFLWGGQGIMMRPNLSAVGWEPTASVPATGAQLATVYAALARGGQWSPWAQLGPMPLAHAETAIRMAKKIGKVSGAQQMAVARAVLDALGQFSPALSGVEMVDLATVQA